METKESSSKTLAVISSGGMQYTVKEGDLINIPQLATAEPKSKITISDVLFVTTEAGTKIGSPLVSGAKVTASVVRQLRDSKVLIYKKKKRKGYTKKQGHRQDLTQIKIESISA